jgi:hypothetical protein
MGRKTARAAARNRNQDRADANIGKAAQRLLTDLATRGRVPHRGQAADILLANDLAEQRSDGSIEISAAGRAHLARREFTRAGTIDPFLGQHLAVADCEVETRAGRTQVAVDVTESPLAWLARRKGRDGSPLITPEQFLSGERLRADFTRAQLMPRMTVNWTSSMTRNGRSAGDATTFTDAAVAARQRLRGALDAVGPEFAGLLLDVCCFLKGLDDAERERGWPSRSAKVVLQLGLERLARHYGYGAEARGATHAAVRTWLAPGAAFGADDDLARE